MIDPRGNSNRPLTTPAGTMTSAIMFGVFSLVCVVFIFVDLRRQASGVLAGGLAVSLGLGALVALGVRAARPSSPKGFWFVALLLFVAYPVLRATAPPLLARGYIEGLFLVACLWSAVDDYIQARRVRTGASPAPKFEPPPPPRIGFAFTVAIGSGVVLAGVGSMIFNGGAGKAFDASRFWSDFLVSVPFTVGAMVLATVLLILARRLAERGASK